MSVVKFLWHFLPMFSRLQCKHDVAWTFRASLLLLLTNWLRWAILWAVAHLPSELTQRYVKIGCWRCWMKFLSAVISISWYGDWFSISFACAIGKKSGKGRSVLWRNAVHIFANFLKWSLSTQQTSTNSYSKLKLYYTFQWIFRL